jgi:hypothetical protein
VYIGKGRTVHLHKLTVPLPTGWQTWREKMPHIIGSLMFIN